MKKDYEEIANELAYIIYRLCEGDYVTGLETLQEHGYVDENQEWIYPEEE